MKNLLLFALKNILGFLFLTIYYPTFANIKNDTLISENNNDYSLEVFYADFNKITIDFHIKNITWTTIPNSDKYVAIINGFNQRHDYKRPSVPFKTILLNIPTSTKVTIDTVSSDFEYIEKELSVAPIPMENTDIQEENNIDNYIGFYPESFILTGDIQIYRYNYLHSFSITPISYSSKSKKIKLYKNFRINITYLNDGSESVFDNLPENFKNVTNLPHPNINNKPFVIIDDKILNPRDVTEDYLIIASSNSDFSEIERFSEWKKRQGFRTHIEKRDEWTPMEIDDIVKSYYYNPQINLNYLVLFNTHEYIPASEYISYSHGYKETKLSDLPYACMDGPDDYTADIFYGRIGAYNDTLLKNTINKIINYQKNPTSDSTFYKNISVISRFEPGNSNPTNARESWDVVRHCEIISSYLKLSNKNITKIYQADSKVFPKLWYPTALTYKYGDQIFSYSSNAKIEEPLQKPNFQWNGSLNDIISSINNGCSMVIYNGHGNVFGWKNFGINPNSLNLLKNTTLNPIIVSGACNTGSLYDSESFAYKTSCNTNGSIITIANNGTSWVPYHNYLIDGIINALYPNPGYYTYPQSTYKNNIIHFNPTIGNIFQNAVSRMNLARGHYTDAMNDNIFGYHIFGDPSTIIYTDVPQKFRKPKISFKNDILTVALDFTDLPASVSFYDTGNNRIEKYEGGMGEYYFENPSDSIISIYISGKNKIPYMVDVKKSEIKDIEEPIAFHHHFQSVKYDHASCYLNIKLDLSTVNGMLTDHISLTINKLGELVKRYIIIDYNESSASLYMPDIENCIYILTLRSPSKVLETYKFIIDKQ